MRRTRAGRCGVVARRTGASASSRTRCTPSPPIGRSRMSASSSGGGVQRVERRAGSRNSTCSVADDGIRPRAVRRRSRASRHRGPSRCRPLPRRSAAGRCARRHRWRGASASRQEWSPCGVHRDDQRISMRALLGGRGRGLPPSEALSSRRASGPDRQHGDVVRLRRAAAEGARRPPVVAHRPRIAAALQRRQQALVAEGLSPRVERLGDAVGVGHQRVAGCSRPRQTG